LFRKLQALFLAKMRRQQSGRRLTKSPSFYAALLLVTSLALTSAGRPHRFGAAWQSEAASRRAGLPAPPKLIIVIIIDQFRPDYLVRFRPQFVEGGFNLLLSGANFVNCRYEQATTITGPGHATLLTGAYPETHGIIGNEWFDRGLGRPVNCVEDPETKLVDDSGTTAKGGASPHYLVGSTLGDELRAADGYQSRVISISLKDRGAILPGGHSANAAYWYSSSTGQFVTSTYYMPSLPRWAAQFNSQSSAKAYCGKSWQALPATPNAGSQAFKSFAPIPNEPCPDKKFLNWLDGTPFMSEVELNFAKEAVKGEQLGHGAATDLLTISLSENDYIGHSYGPYSPELADMTLRTDRYLADFFKSINNEVGLGNVWIALSADHGVAPNPKFITQHRLGPGHASIEDVVQAVDAALSSKFGPDAYVLSASEGGMYLDPRALEKHKATEDEAEEIGAREARKVPGVRMVLTRYQLSEGLLPLNPLSASVSKSFFSPRSGDLFVVFDPFAVPVRGETQTTHGSPWNYDAQVPLLLWGSAFEPGVYVFPCHPVDLAPTLAVALGLNQTSGAQGRPLGEALK
jgi:predicted AlkP superfamily pyrophosphatase or phosphodiesterase